MGKRRAQFPVLQAFVLTTLVCALCCTSNARGQGRVPFENVTGAWETSDANGIDGIFLQILGGHVQLRVFHRSQDGRETWGWYSPDLSGGSETMDGAHLRTGQIDLRFDYSGQKWVGSWSAAPLRIAGRDVELTRPQPSRAATSAFVGEWTSGPTRDGPPFDVPARLHVAESRDGHFTAWIDSAIGFGELLDVRSATNGTLILGTTNATGTTFRYTGTLAADGMTLTGGWMSMLPSGGMSSYPNTFTRARR